jgi:hypothetical protein
VVSTGNSFTPVRDIDGDSLTVQEGGPNTRPGVVAVIHVDEDGTWNDFDRAGAVALIAALTDAVEAHDAREAAEEARKLKRGDVVWPCERLRDLHRSNSDFRYVVLADEADGLVELVCAASPLPHDQIGADSLFTAPARDYERVPA